MIMPHEIALSFKKGQIIKTGSGRSEFEVTSTFDQGLNINKVGNRIYFSQIAAVANHIENTDHLTEEQIRQVLRREGVPDTTTTEVYILGLAKAYVLSRRKFESDIENGRRKILAEISAREGQGVFRTGVLSAYKNKCAISGFDAPDALEAAHIYPYDGGEDANRISNGILLRADLHTLFDRLLISIDSASWKIIVSESLMQTKYGDIAGSILSLPENSECRPNKNAIDWHRKKANIG